MSKQINWKLVSDVRASKRRTQVLKVVAKEPKMNSELADELGLSTGWIRQQVKWLEKRNLIEELTGKHNYHLYRATEKGEKIATYL